MTFTTNAETQVYRAEADLRQAMLAGNVEQLDALIDDQLIFVGPDGNLYSKDDDLQLHRSGQEKIERIEVEDQVINSRDEVVVVSLIARMAGIFKGEGFQGRFRYLRIWKLTSTGWKIIAGSVCQLPQE
jgi:hypothetical protein